MAGLGGSLGYLMGALNWDATFIGDVFGGHVRAVFTIVLFIFLFCVFITIFSFNEIPLESLSSREMVSDMPTLNTFPSIIVSSDICPPTKTQRENFLAKPTLFIIIKLQYT